MREFRVWPVGRVSSPVCQVSPVQAYQVLQQGVPAQGLAVPPPLVCCIIYHELSGAAAAPAECSSCNRRTHHARECSADDGANDANIFAAAAPVKRAGAADAAIMLTAFSDMKAIFVSIGWKAKCRRGHDHLTHLPPKNLLTKLLAMYKALHFSCICLILFLFCHLRSLRFAP